MAKKQPQAVRSQAFGCNTLAMLLQKLRTADLEEIVLWHLFISCLMLLLIASHHACHKSAPFSLKRGSAAELPHPDQNGLTITKMDFILKSRP